MNVYVKAGARICIGKAGENNATKVLFDIGDWIAEYGEGKVELLISLNGTTYPREITQTGSLVTWLVNSSDTARSGAGRCELTYRVNDIIVKSEAYQLYVVGSLGEGEDLPPPAYKSWVNEILQAAAEVKTLLDNLPIASQNKLGLIKIGEGLTIDENGVLSIVKTEE